MLVTAAVVKVSSQTTSAEASAAGDITALGVLPPPVAQYGGAGIVDAQDRSGLFVVDLDQPRRLERLFARLRNHNSHVLAVMHNPVVPQRERRNGRRGESGRITWELHVTPVGFRTAAWLELARWGCRRC